MPRAKPRTDKTSRCVILLGALVRTKRGIELSAFFKTRGWGWRSAYRDVATLKKVGIPVEQPKRGWYRVADGWVPPGAIDVSRDQLAALDSARRLFPVLEGLQTLWTRLCVDRQLSLPFEVAIEGRTPAIDYTPHRLTIATLQRSINDSRITQIVYRDASGSETERRVDPVALRWDSAFESLYLIAWCRTRHAVRTFAIHRIVSTGLTDETFERRVDAVEQLNSAFRICARPNAEQVSLMFSAAVSREIRERRWHSSQVMSVLQDGSVRLTMRLAAPEELERILLGYGPEVVVEAPASLAERVRELHVRSLSRERFGARRGEARTVLERRTASR